ncbi:MAG: glycerol-3-phosphate dehydrogenase [Flavobacteriales bacterium]|nr:glycerol-3-phosphate dehydrogenase [Flavobacteriales bacterium]
MNILVLGAGTFGTAIANELAINKNNNVILFSRSKDKVREINQNSTNQNFFPNKKLTKELTATSDINDIKHIDIIFIALPSSKIIDTLFSIKHIFKKDVLIINLSKGLYKDGITIVESIKKKIDIKNVITLKGPSFAVEIMEHAETLLTLGYSTSNQYRTVIKIIKNTSLNIDSTKDILGVEVLSVLKNIYALFIGVIDAKYDSPNTRFMFLTKAFSEIRIILKFLGGKEETLFLGCGFGDLCLTSLNDLSRNRTLGLLIGKNFFNFNDNSNNTILEGVRAIMIMNNLLPKQLKRSLPIFNKLNNFFSKKKQKFEIDFKQLFKT